MRSSTYGGGIVPIERCGGLAPNAGMRISVLLLTMGLAAAAAAGETTKSEIAAVLRKTPDPANGEALFRQCVSCHGTDGSGEDNGNVPRIAGQHGSVVIKQIVDFRHQRRWDFRMERIADHDHLDSHQDIADVADYVSRLDSSGPRDLGAGDDVDAGKAVFGARCAGCHGDNAVGDARDVVPRLAGQHYRYLIRQLYDAAEGRRSNLDRVHDRGIRRMTFEEIAAVGDYLSRLDWPAARAAR
jgi:cytochrome c553